LFALGRVPERLEDLQGDGRFQITWIRAVEQRESPFRDEALYLVLLGDDGPDEAQGIVLGPWSVRSSREGEREVEG